MSAKSDTSDEGRAGSLSPALPVRRTSRPLHNSNSHINNNNKKRNSTTNINHSAGGEVMGSRRQNDNLNVIRKISVQAGGAGPRVLDAKKPLAVKGSLKVCCTRIIIKYPYTHVGTYCEQNLLFLHRFLISADGFL